MKTQHFTQALRFWLRSSQLICKRGLQNSFSNIRKFSDTSTLKGSHVIALSESLLWNEEDTEANWVLTAGKVENLRIAARSFNGIEIPAGETFSFWKQLGNPNIGKSFKTGREIREGCILPTKAGGLCQLSNALYDAALKAGFDILERHKHSQVIKGSLAEQDRDAVVKWNYLDLRFRSAHAFRIEVELSSEKLSVKFLSTHTASTASDAPAKLHSPSVLNDCYSCGNHHCFRHPAKRTLNTITGASTAFILDRKWPEYDAYIKTISNEKDLFILPVGKAGLLRFSNYAWTIKTKKKVVSLFSVSVLRALRLRFLPASQNVFAETLHLDKKLAAAAAKKIPYTCTHLVVSQNLLPFLAEEGVLAGRTYDVLMTRLPLENLHSRLDLAFSKHPDSKTLKDHRASEHLVTTEKKALNGAHHILSPHPEIAQMFRNKCLQLSWQIPFIEKKKQNAIHKLVFPAAALGRKGAYEVRKLAKELALTVVLPASVKADHNFWSGVTTELAENLLDTGGLIVYPAYVEHEPRFLLKALSAGCRVIATPACGLLPQQGLVLVSCGDYEALKVEVLKLLAEEIV